MSQVDISYNFCCILFLSIKIRRLASVSHHLFLLIFGGTRTHQQIVEKAHQVLDRCLIHISSRAITCNLLLAWKTRRRRTSRFRCTAWPCHTSPSTGPERIVVLSKRRPCLWWHRRRSSIPLFGAIGICQACCARIVSPSWTWWQCQWWEGRGFSHSWLFGWTYFCSTPVVKQLTCIDRQWRSIDTSAAWTWIWLKVKIKIKSCALTE